MSSKRKIADEDDGGGANPVAGSSSSSSNIKKKKTSHKKHKEEPIDHATAVANTLANLNFEERKILDELRKHPNGLPQAVLQQALPDIDLKDLLESINSLSVKQVVEFISHGRELFFRAKSDEEFKKTKGLSDEELMVYNVIKSAGNRGIWVRHIKEKSNLHEKSVTKCLDKLSNSLLVKCMTSVKFKTRRLYMLAEVMPSVEVTGGVFYTDQEFDTELADQVSLVCHHHIINKTYCDGDMLKPRDSRYKNWATAQSCLKYVAGLGVLNNTDLSVEDIVRVLNRLVYDGKITRYRRDGKSNEIIKVKDEPVKPAKASKSTKKGAAASKKPTRAAARRAAAALAEDSDENQDDMGSDIELPELDPDALKDEETGGYGPREKKQPPPAEDSNDFDDGDDIAEALAGEVDMYYYEAIRPSEYREEIGKDALPSFFQPGEKGQAPRLPGNEWSGRWSALSSVPCGTCPVASFCSDNGPVNPSSCVYITNWMAEW
ncbi:hypothetical protein SmJEL517_g05509 [Synchytrium microbalum]|uniref:DNA-directed RNA polymerase III subunit RPC6 n=1 Tax=Synchytrium microbalum TaxID=1806994 RepID=A0A507BU40_9FUNG|nr:uncharacterized protein SmJEL517_g05509 [Synchytrium microbalum]TPX31092.1 hypothetical protein SmJEL517_g05509 [Synchytrium microbalum]